jgi:hypothetical protein
MAPASPGPDAERAFDTGLAAVTVGGLAAIGICSWTGLFTPMETVLAVALGMPTLVVVASCLLGVWVGYDEASLVRVAAEREERSDGR